MRRTSSGYRRLPTATTHDLLTSAFDEPAIQVDLRLRARRYTQLLPNRSGDHGDTFRVLAHEPNRVSKFRRNLQRFIIQGKLQGESGYVDTDHPLLTIVPNDYKAFVLEIIPKIRIHYNLTLTALLHATVCCDSESAKTGLAEISRLIAESFGDGITSLSVILNQELVYHRLTSFLSKTSHSQSPSASPSCGGQCVVAICPSKDLAIMAYILIEMLTEPDGILRKQILSLKGEESQSLVNTLYSFTQLKLHANFQTVLNKALFQLAKESGSYPTELVIENVQFDRDDLVGHGGFADVYRGTYRNEVVAIKRARVIESDFQTMFRILKECARELVVWSRLSHRNILPLRGIFLDKSRQGKEGLAFVSPFMEHGDLNRYLRSSKACSKISLVLDITRGLVYLHSQKPPVIHGDLKPANVFISADGRACIGDYGLSYIKDSAQKHWTTTNHCGQGKTLQYSAPELLDENAPMSRSRDIYAFGCVVYEMYAGEPPYAGLSEVQIILSIMRNKPLEKPKGIGNRLWTILEACRSHSHIDRPQANDVMGMLRQLRSDDNIRMNRFPHSMTT